MPFSPSRKITNLVLTLEVFNAIAAMEAIGCTLAVLPIFSLCLEYFEYFKTAQSLSADCQILLLKLDFEHERLIIWGEKHGIGNDANGIQDCGPDNWTTNKLKLVKDALNLIEALFKDSRALYDKYGVKQLEPNNEHGQVEVGEKFISTAAPAALQSGHKAIPHRTPAEHNSPNCAVVRACRLAKTYSKSNNCITPRRFPQQAVQRTKKDDTWGGGGDFPKA